MNLNRKTIIIVIAGTAAIVLIALGILWYANRSNETKTVKNLFGILPQIGGGGGDGGATNNSQPITNNGEGAPEGNETGGETVDEIAPEDNLLQIVKKAILGATLTANGDKIIYYVRAGGKLEMVDFSGGTPEQISPLTIVGMFDVVWQKAKRRNIVSYLEETTIKRFINATATTSVVFLPEGIRLFDFSPDSRSLAYLLQKNGATQLITATEEGKNPKVVFETPISDFSLLWIAPKKILLQSAPSNRAPSIIYLFDTGTKTLEKIFSDIRGSMTIASPDGNTILTSFVENNGRIALTLTNQKGENGRTVAPATLAEKCIFTKDAKTLYCAISQESADLPAQQQAGLPDEWLRGDTALQDQFVRIPINTLTAEALSDKTKIDAINLFLSPDGQYLFFQDKNDLTLWRLKIP